VTDEYNTAIGDDGDSAFQHGVEVFDVGEMSENRVKDHEIEALWPDACKILRLAALQLNVRKAARCNVYLEFAENYARKICAQVCGAAWRKSLQQQSGAAADLEHPIRSKREESLDGGFAPFPHRFGWNRLSGIAAVPTDHIEGRIVLRRVL